TNRLGDRFGGFVVRPSGLRRWPAQSGRLALFGLLRSPLDEPRTPPGTAVDNLPEALDRFARPNPRRGLRVVVSVFLAGRAAGELTARPGWERAMKRLAVRHQVLAIEILDPRELELPNVGVCWLTDPETGVVREVDTSDRRLRERYAAAAAA